MKTFWMTNPDVLIKNKTIIGIMCDDELAFNIFIGEIKNTADEKGVSLDNHVFIGRDNMNFSGLNFSDVIMYRPEARFQMLGNMSITRNATCSIR